MNALGGPQRRSTRHGSSSSPPVAGSCPTLPPPVNSSSSQPFEDLGLFVQSLSSAVGNAPSERWERLQASLALLPPRTSAPLSAGLRQLTQAVQELEQVAIPSSPRSSATQRSFLLHRYCPALLQQAEKNLQVAWEELDVERSMTAQAEARRRSWRRQMSLRMATAEETHSMLTAQLANLTEQYERRQLQRQSLLQQRTQIERRIFECYAGWDLRKRKLEALHQLQEDSDGRSTALAEMEVHGVKSRVFPQQQQDSGEATTTGGRNSAAAAVPTTTESSVKKVNAASAAADDDLLIGIHLVEGSPRRRRRLARGEGSSVEWLVSVERHMEEFLRRHGCE